MGRAVHLRKRMQSINLTRWVVCTLRRTIMSATDLRGPYLVSRRETTEYASSTGATDFPTRSVIGRVLQVWRPTSTIRSLASLFSKTDAPVEE